jgi:hypothetical protein
MAFRWVFSDQPADWIAALALLISFATLLVTAAYVVFTYRLLRTAVNQEAAAAKATRLALQEAHLQRMERLGPLLATVVDVLNEVHYFRQRFTNTFDHHNILQQKPDPPLYAPLEAVRGIAPTVSLKMHNHISVAVARLKVLDHLHQEVGATLRGSVGRGLTGAAAEEVKKVAEEECKNLEFYLQPVREELERILTETPV